MALYAHLVRVPPNLIDSITEYDGFRYATGTLPHQEGSGAEKLRLAKAPGFEVFTERSSLDLLSEAVHGLHPFTVHVPANQPGVGNPRPHTFGDGTRHTTPQEVADLAARLRAEKFEEAPVKDVPIERVDTGRRWAVRLREFYGEAARAGQAVIVFWS